MLWNIELYIVSKVYMRRLFISVLLSTGTCQYCLNGRHHTPRYNISMTTKPNTTYPATTLTAHCCLSPSVSLLYISNRHILHPQMVTSIDSSTMRTSFDPRIRDMIEVGVSAGISSGSIRFVSRDATMFIHDTKTVYATLQC